MPCHEFMHHGRGMSQGHGQGQMDVCLISYAILVNALLTTDAQVRCNIAQQNLSSRTVCLLQSRKSIAAISKREVNVY